MADVAVGTPPSSSAYRLSPAARWRARRPALAQAFSAVWLPWLLARAMVLGTLALAKYEITTFRIVDPKATAAAHFGLLGSDAGWYQQIAAHGYAATGRASIRFFPLLPMAGRFLHDMTGLTPGIAIVVITNLSALVAAMALYLLVHHELGDDVMAVRAAWLISLAAPAFVLVMGYAEAPFLVLAIAAFYCLRRRLWLLAGLAGYLAGLTRPIGCLLALAAVVEVLRHRDSLSAREVLGRGVAVVAPVAGLMTYLSWAQGQFGDFFGPLRSQFSSSHHGGLADPFATLWHAAKDVAHHHVGTALHVPWILLVAVLLIQAFRILPLSYGLFALAVVGVAVSGHNLDSFERYALSAFPLLIAGASLIKSARVSVPAYIVLAATLVVYSLLAFLGAYVP